MRLVNLFKLVGAGLSLVCCLIIRVRLVVFFCSGVSVVLFHTLGFSGCHGAFLSGSHLRLVMGLIRGWFVPFVDSLMG